MLSLAAWAAAQERDGGQADSCKTCHELFEGTPVGDMVKSFAQGVHAKAGLSCAACHGGDPSSDDKTLSMSPDRGYKGVPDFADIPAMCGECHSSAEYMRRFDPSLRIDQVAEYRTSVHGQKAAQGDQKVATCTSCHGVHGILSANHPSAPVHPLRLADTCAQCHGDAGYMADYEVATGQAEEFKASVHGIALYEKRDLGAATCNDCHGNHGAAPPGVDSVANVCGNCHGIQRDLFQEGSHGQIFDLFELNDCVTCHGNHAVAPPDETMLTSDTSPCLDCHEQDAGTEAAQAMASTITGLRAEIAEARALLHRAEQAGMEVSEPIFRLHEAEEHVIQARNQVHLVNPARVGETVQGGLAIAEQAEQAAHQAFQDLAYRRRGLFVALAIIAVVIVCLAAWIRVVDRRHEKSAQAS